MRKYYDISMSIEPGMDVYKGRENKRPEVWQEATFEKDGVNESSIKMNLHTGTHIDASLHMLESGASLDDMDLSRVMTMCKVFDLTNIYPKIRAEDIQHLDINKDDFIIFKTDNSFSGRGSDSFVYLDQEAASFLAQVNISGLGIDALGIERDQHGHPSHKRLLNQDVIILEGLHLADVPEGNYMLIALPLKIKGAEAAPARAVLLSVDYFEDVLNNNEDKKAL